MTTCLNFSTSYRPKGAVTEKLMELPQRKSGDVDWNTLGNILVAHELGEVLCASYVDRLYGQEDPGFEADTDWRFFYKEKDVVVLKKQFEDSPIHCYMGRSVVELPVNVIHNFLAVNENALHYDRLCVESRKITNYRDETDIKDCISYLRYESKQCLIKTKRDFVFYARWQVMSDGKCVMSTLSIDHPNIPLVSGITRAQLLPGSGWVLEPYRGDPNKTLISYLVHVDLMSLPPLITNRVMRRVPLSIHHLREYLLANPPVTRPLHLYTLSSQHSTMDRQAELPTSPQIPTPVPVIETYPDLSSLPMESNPLYQSSNLFVCSTRLRTQSQESWKCRGTENERLLENGNLRHVSTLQEEDEEGSPTAADAEVLSATWSEVEARLDTSHSYLTPFEMTGSGRDESLTKVRSKEQAGQDEWLLVPNAQHNPTPSEEIVTVEKAVDTPEVSPGSSQGNEWTNASSNNE